jgi:hypothetical protein
VPHARLLLASFVLKVDLSVLTHHKGVLDILLDRGRDLEPLWTLFTLLAKDRLLIFSPLKLIKDSIHIDL